MQPAVRPVLLRLAVSVVIRHKSTSQVVCREFSVRYWEDFSPGEVETFGAYRVEADEIAMFSQRFGAATSMAADEASQAMAPQMLVCGIFMRLLVDHLLVRSASMGSPGMDSITWPHPVAAGDVLSVRMELLHARPLESRKDLGLIKHRAEVVNQDGVVVARLVANALFRRRQASA
jgi:acyl dehydratase